MHTQKICPFCTPAIKENSFLESDNFLAIYNIAPILPGHTLVIPKAHITSMMELTENDLFEFVSFSRKVVKILTYAFNTGAFNWTMQEKEEAGQTVIHMHIHIIPRFPDDLSNPGDWYPKLQNNIANLIDSDKRPKLTQHEIQSIIRKLKNTASKIYPGY